MASAGMCVTLKGGNGVPVQIFFDMDMNAADEVALKFVLHCKGHAGLKPCMVFVCQTGIWKEKILTARKL